MVRFLKDIDSKTNPSNENKKEKGEKEKKNILDYVVFPKYSIYRFHHIKVCSRTFEATSFTCKLQKYM